MPPEAEKLLETLAGKLGELPDETAIVGIHTGGVWVADRLRSLLGNRHAYGTLAVTLHRDDFGAIGLHRQKKSTDIGFNVDGRDILLVDDVIHSGRTLRAALNELFDFGRPARVRLACLVDRGGRELPFAPDFTGGLVSLADHQSISLTNEGGLLRFEIRERAK
jgi:pyrimidine operon attenuation protein/uracil phosphoribosyltransferase